MEPPKKEKTIEINVYQRTCIVFIDQLAYMETAHLAVYDSRVARELCFQWGIGENDARTLAYEVAPAAKPPQVNSH